MQSCKQRLSRCPSLVRWVCFAFCGAMWLCQYALQADTAQVKSAAAPSPTPRREEAYDRPLLGPGCLPRSPDKTRLRICKSISRLRNHRHSQPPQPAAALHATPGGALAATPTPGRRRPPPPRRGSPRPSVVPSTLTDQDAHRKGRPAARAADDGRRDRPVLGGEQGRRYDGQRGVQDRARRGAHRAVAAAQAHGVRRG